MNGIPWYQMVRDQFISSAPPTVERPGLRRLQLLWLVFGLMAGVLAFFSKQLPASVGFVLGANAIFALLSLTMAMLFWPQAINLKNDPKVYNSDQRWYLYKMSTQMFWALSISILATVMTFAAIGLDHRVPVLALGDSILLATSVALTVYQALLLLQCIQQLYSATYWLTRV